MWLAAAQYVLLLLPDTAASQKVSHRSLRKPWLSPCTGFSFINGAPAAEPASLWLAARAGGAAQGESYFPPSLYSQLLGQATSTADEWHAYTIDWQPTHVSWWVAGQWADGAG